MSVPFAQHNKRAVTSLYRQSLRLAKSWINRRDLFRAKAVEIRQQFDENRDITDFRKSEALIQSTRDLLKRYAHPDPIIPSQRPGGTRFERNVPPPEGKIWDEGW